MTSSEISILFCSSSEITFLQYLGKGEGKGGREGEGEEKLLRQCHFSFKAKSSTFPPVVDTQGTPKEHEN